KSDRGTPAAKAPVSTAPSVGGQGKPPPNRSRTWFDTHGRDLRFLLVFVVLMVIYYAGTTTSAMKDRFFPWYLDANARASVALLRTFNYPDVVQQGESVVSPRGSITVARGCDAIEPSALFVSAVLASPVALGSRLLAAVVGTVLLLSINLVRIISLFLCAVYWKSAFNVMHLDVWQALFIFLAILFWALWAAWAVKRRKKQQADVRA
ncbi:MAG: archaeosortase/exosortase family protein, partial [Phycisphaerales bacterium]|nr:archaeosortase/exosortase family protein [Phycisphaerales bacterium]